MFKAVDKWLPGYLRSVRMRPAGGFAGRHILFGIADHYEPFRGGADRNDAVGTVERWCRLYRETFAEVRDDEGRCPRHTFFYPEEEYDSECLDRLAALCRDGWGEVEVHLHHRHDTPEGFRGKLTTFRDRLRSDHELLGSDRTGAVRYGFVHGNWALCNSRPDGDWCGVNEELGILRSTGCYADFTFPSVPSPTQPRMVNSIYYARDQQGRPRGHDAGRRVAVGSTAADDELILIQGPLGLNWTQRKWGVLPRIENGEITGANPPSRSRARLWLEQAIRVEGEDDWIFVKLHTHGCLDATMRELFGDTVREAHQCLREWVCASGGHLHYVTAREMYNIVRAAADGQNGDPMAYRDFDVAAPAGHPAAGRGQ